MERALLPGQSHAGGSPKTSRLLGLGPCRSNSKPLPPLPVSETLNKNHKPGYNSRVSPILGGDFTCIRTSLVGIFVVSTTVLLGAGTGLGFWAIPVVCVVCLVFKKCALKHIMQCIQPKEFGAPSTLRDSLALKVDHEFCEVYNSMYNGTEKNITKAGGTVRIRSLKVIAAQIKAAKSYAGEHDQLQLRMVTGLFKKLSCDPELLPFARELREEFPEVFPENSYMQARNCTENAKVGKIDTKTEKGKPRAAYLLEARQVESGFKSSFGSFVEFLKHKDVPEALSDAYKGWQPKGEYYNGHSVARNNLGQTRVQNVHHNTLTTEFKQFAEGKGFIVREENAVRFHAAFNPNYASAYLTENAAEQLHQDNDCTHSVTISALTSSVTDDANPGGGLLFVKKGGGRVGTVRDGHVMVFESDAYHGSDQNQLWEKSELKQFETLIDRLEEAINKGNVEEKDKVIGEVRALQAARVSRILSKTEIHLYKKDKLSQFRACTRQERVDFLDAFNKHWQRSSSPKGQ